MHCHNNLNKNHLPCYKFQKNSFGFDYCPAFLNNIGEIRLDAIKGHRMRLIWDYLEKRRRKYFSKSKLLSRRETYPFLRRQISATLAKISPGAQILNIGSCGGYANLVKEAANKANAKLLNIDINEKYHPDLVCDTTDLPLPENFFDILVFADILES